MAEAYIEIEYIEASDIISKKISNSNCDATITIAREAEVIANVYPSYLNCGRCALSPYCSASLEDSLHQSG
jgi:hypothetical protein